MVVTIILVPYLFLRIHWLKKGNKVMKEIIEENPPPLWNMIKNENNID